MTTTVSGIVLTAPATIVFPKLAKAEPYLDPRTGQPKGEPKFSATLVFEPTASLVIGPVDGKPGYTTTWELLRQTAVTVARAKWPDLDPKAIAWPFKNGDKEIARLTAPTAKKPKKPEQLAYLKGKVFIKTDTKYPPFVLDTNKAILQGDAITAAIYGGCVVSAELNFVAYPRAKDDDKDGVKAYLNGILKLADGTRLGGRDVQSAFAGIAGGQSDVDPTGGDLGEEIPY